MDSDTVISVLGLLISFLSLVISFYALYISRKDKQPRLTIYCVYNRNSAEGPTLLISITNNSEQRTQVQGSPMFGYKSTGPEQMKLLGPVDHSFWMDPGEYKVLTVQLSSNAQRWLEKAIEQKKTPYIFVNDGRMNLYRSKPIVWERPASLARLLNHEP